MKKLSLLFIIAATLGCSPIQNINQCRPVDGGYMYLAYAGCPGKSGKTAAGRNGYDAKYGAKRVLKQARKEDRLWKSMNSGNKQLAQAKKRSRIYWRQYNRRK